MKACMCSEAASVPSLGYVLHLVGSLASYRNLTVVDDAVVKQGDTRTWYGHRYFTEDVVTLLKRLEDLNECTTTNHLVRILKFSRSVWRGHEVTMPLYTSDLLVYADCMESFEEYEEAFSRMAYQMALAVQQTHTLGFVHMDVKPDNFLFDNNGRVYLGDFDFAWKRVENGIPWPRGTKAYLAPEADGKSVVDYSADIYSFGRSLMTLSGVVLHDVLGSNPGSSCSELMKVSSETWRTIKEDPLLLDLLTKCVAPQDNRFKTMEDVLKHPYFEDMADLPIPITHKLIKYAEAIRDKGRAL